MTRDPEFWNSVAAARRDEAERRLRSVNRRQFIRDVIAIVVFGGLLAVFIRWIF